MNDDENSAPDLAAQYYGLEEQYKEHKAKAREHTAAAHLILEVVRYGNGVCETVKPLVELCNKRPEFVDQAAIAYYRVMTVKPDVMYRAVVTAALYIQGADYEAMKKAVEMTLRDEN